MHNIITTNGDFSLLILASGTSFILAYSMIIIQEARIKKNREKTAMSLLKLYRETLAYYLEHSSPNTRNFFNIDILLQYSDIYCKSERTRKEFENFIQIFYKWVLGEYIAGKEETYDNYEQYIEDAKRRLS